MAEAAVTSDGYRLTRVASYDAWDANMIYVSNWLLPPRTDYTGAGHFGTIRRSTGM